jgi:hypothetical protein
VPEGNDGLEPRVEILLVNLLLNDFETISPDGGRIDFHSKGVKRNKLGPKKQGRVTKV